VESESLGHFLATLDTPGAQQFIIGVFAEWAEREYQKRSGNFDKGEATRSYLRSLKLGPATRLSLLTAQIRARSKRKLSDAPPSTHFRRLNEVVSLVEDMSPDEATFFLAEVTAGWCFAMPENAVRRMPDPPWHMSDKAFADAIYTWFVEYFDMWH
jgi:hypothetical protein